jgi:uncharacterized membrane protein YoaK (UPF0700 family)
MIRHEPRERVLAVGLASLAGYVDALGFMHLRGFFLSFMSGNSTRLGVDAALGAGSIAIPAAIVGLFVLGVIGGSLAAHVSGRFRPVAVLVAVTVLLAAAASFDLAGFAWLAIAAAVIAMGCENAVFERDGEVSIGLTYMTGALVKLGQRITAALLGGARFAWIWYLALWMGLVGGAAAGASVYARLGLQGLWFAAALAAAFTIIAGLTMVPRSGQ